MASTVEDIAFQLERQLAEATAKVRRRRGDVGRTTTRAADDAHGGRRWSLAVQPASRLALRVAHQPPSDRSRARDGIP